MKIDLKARKTEGGWSKAWENFALSATPKWFEWLGWVLILGALTFLAEKTDSTALHVILAISGALFMLYFINFFFQFEFKNIPFLKRRAAARIVALLVSGLIGGGLWLLFRQIVDQLGRTGT